MFLNLFTGFLGPVAALIIWLVYKDRSSRMAFNALQSMCYQIGWLMILLTVGAHSMFRLVRMPQVLPIMIVTFLAFSLPPKPVPH